VGSRLSSPGQQQRRFAAYIEGLANAAGHADRHTPLKNYCTGLLLPGERKSVEPMAARVAPDNVRRTHQSLHHLVADAPWDDGEMLAAARRQVLPAMQKKFHPAEFLKRGAAPVGRGTHRFESALALSSILVAQHPQFSGTNPAQSVRTKQPKPLVIDSFYRLPARYGRPDQPINILNSLDSCLDNTHSSSP
jgi:hypothetical protein